MKKLFAASCLVLAAAAAPAFADVQDASVQVSDENDPWSCTNSLNAAIANAYNECVLGGGVFTQVTLTACFQTPHGWSGSSQASCTTPN